MTQKQDTTENNIATLHAKIRDLERKNREQAAIIRNQNEWITDLRADVLTYQKLLAQSIGAPLPMEQAPPKGCRTIKLQPNY